MQSARDIYQANLDAVTRAFWTRRFDRLPFHIGIPGQMITDDGEIVIGSTDELIVLMQDFREKLASLGGVSYHRRCRHARFADTQNSVVIGLHDTVLKDAKDVVIGAYSNRMTLMRDDHTWKSVRIDSSAENKKFNVVSPDFAKAQREEFQRINDRLGTGLPD